MNSSKRANIRAKYFMVTFIKFNFLTPTFYSFQFYIYTHISNKIIFCGKMSFLFLIVDFTIAKTKYTHVAHNNNNFIRS